MRTARDIYTELKAAFGTKWSVLGLLLAGFVSRFDWVAHKLASRGMSELIGIPDWVVAIIILSVWSAATAIWHAVKLRRLITPKLSLSFDQGGIGIQGALDQINEFDGHGNLLRLTEVQASYVRVLVDTVAKTAVTDCVAFLKDKIEKRAPGGGPITEIPLPHRIALGVSNAIGKIEPFSVYPELPHMLDFVKSSSHDNKLVVVGYWPFHLRDAFNDIAIYRFTIAVVAAGVTTSIKMDVNWRGRWDTIGVNEASQGQ